MKTFTYSLAVTNRKPFFDCTLKVKGLRFGQYEPNKKWGG